MRRDRIALYLGLVLYLVSFSLWAVWGESFSRANSVRGYMCAYSSLFVGWDFLAKKQWHDVWLGLTLLISGLVNPAFVVVAILALCQKGASSFRFLRVLLLLMIATTALALYLAQLYPREGYFAWTLGMLLVLFANRLTLRSVPSN